MRNSYYSYYSTNFGRVSTNYQLIFLQSPKKIYVQQSIVFLNAKDYYGLRREVFNVART